MGVTKEGRLLVTVTPREATDFYIGRQRGRDRKGLLSSFRRASTSRPSSEPRSEAPAHVSVLQVVFVILIRKAFLVILDFFSARRAVCQVAGPVIIIKRLHFLDIDEAKQFLETLFHIGGGQILGYSPKEHLGYFCQLPDHRVFIPDHPFNSFKHDVNFIFEQ